jgi:hypothetical protein
MPVSDDKSPSDDKSANNDKSPIDQALDLAFFGPVGLVLTVRDALPGWVDKGRRVLGPQVQLARFIGEQAARYGQRMATDALVGFGLLPGAPPPQSGEGAEMHPEATVPSSNGATSTTSGSDPGMTPTAASKGAVGDVPGSAELAIPGYDSLSASQVVQRLAGLSTNELEAVRSYEAAGRGRRTILTKVSQLQAGRS